MTGGKVYLEFSIPLSSTMICTQCSEEKSIDDFTNDKYKKTGKKAWCKSCSAARALSWYYSEHDQHKKEGRERKYTKGRNASLKRSFGITCDEYDQMLTEQNNSCFLCEETDRSNRRLSVDHGSTGNRKLLCFNCNTALGNFKHSPNLLRKAADYLENHGIYDS